MNEEEAKKIVKGLETYYDNDLLDEEEIEENKLVNNAIETVLNLLEKKDTLINTMQAEFERLEDLEDNTDMLKLELQKKDKIIDEMAEEIESLYTFLVDEFGTWRAKV